MLTVEAKEMIRISFRSLNKTGSVLVSDRTAAVSKHHRMIEVNHRKPHKIARFSYNILNILSISKILKNILTLVDCSISIDKLILQRTAYKKLLSRYR